MCVSWYACVPLPSSPRAASRPVCGVLQPCWREGRLMPMHSFSCISKSNHLCTRSLCAGAKVVCGGLRVRSSHRANRSQLHTACGGGYAAAVCHAIYEYAGRRLLSRLCWALRLRPLDINVSIACLLYFPSFLTARTFACSCSSLFLQHHLIPSPSSLRRLLGVPSAVLCPAPLLCAGPAASGCTLHPSDAQELRR